MSSPSHVSEMSTLVLGADDVARLIAQRGIDMVLRELADEIEHDFRRWDAFDKSARTAAHSSDGVIELMPIADDRTFTFKYVNGHPKNTAVGLPTVMAFGVLADVATGMPLLLSDLTLTTAVRTAAVSVVAARALARPDSRCMAMIGNGAQADFQAIAFHQLMGITEVRLFDTDAAATEKLIANLRAEPLTQNLHIVRCASAAEAVRGAHIVTTATADKTNAAVVTPEVIVPGMHLNALGGDCPGKTEIPPDVTAMASVFVEYEPQTRIEGDIQHMPADFPVTALWQVLTGAAPGRRDAKEITMFDSVGFALEDFSALRYLRHLATADGRGENLALIPNLSDPKDLYQLVSPRLVVT